jgi:predicted ribosome quality control (RQC) complex YloA/Tae2 family protein
MQYGILKKWAEENAKQNLAFHRFERFEDRYRISFKKQKKHLQINLSSQECFCFFSSESSLPFSEKKELLHFNQNLSGSKLQTISISDSDRIIFLEFNQIDIYNQENNYQLILELIPRYQNMIMVRNGIILDCIRKISFAQNRHRQILPGIKYEMPPTEFSVEENDIDYPLSIGENGKIITARSGFNDMNSVMIEFSKLMLRKKLEQRKRNLISSVNKKINQKKKKLEKLQNELKNSEAEESWKQQAELLKANYSLIKQGLEEIRVTNYFEEEFPEICIKLDTSKSPQQNVEYYFKKYRKARDGKVKISEQIEITNNEIKVLDNEIAYIKINDTQTEIEVTTSSNKSTQTEKFRKLKIDENWEIIIGRTSKENDEITTRLAKPHDWWFHTRIFRGTHVLLRNLKKMELPDNLKMLCCRLAAYYSRAKKSSNVPVDYTQIRYVRKPRGAATGFVVYTNQKTLYVDPLSMRDAADIIEDSKSKL